MRRAVFSVVLGCLACVETPASPAPDATVDVPDVADAAARDAEVAADRPPATLAGLRCGAPSPWAEPIADYLAVGERQTMGGDFLRAVQDLHVYEDRLYLGYGDANVNLGRATPIEVRAFADDARPEAASEFRTDEEQIERYRELDGDLWIPGVDATEDAWLGNVYWRARAPAGGPGRRDRREETGPQRRRPRTPSSASRLARPSARQRPGDQPSSGCGASAVSLNGCSSVIDRQQKRSAVQVVHIVMLAWPGGTGS